MGYKIEKRERKRKSADKLGGFCRSTSEVVFVEMENGFEVASEDGDGSP